MDDGLIGVLVVDYQEVPPVVVEQRHAVIVVAEGALLACAGAAVLMVEGSAVRPKRGAPAGDYMPAIAFRDGHCVQRIGGDFLELKAVGRVPNPRHQCAGDEGRRAPGGEAPA